MTKKSTKIKSRGDTGIMRPDGVSRGEQREQFDDDVKQIRLNPSTYKEHDAESKMLSHERGTKSDTMAQTVRFSFRCGIGSCALTQRKRQFTPAFTYLGSLSV